MNQCPYYFHTMTNMSPRRCEKEEGHSGEHVQEQLPKPQNFMPPTGWIKHG